MARAYLHRQAREARELLAPFSPGGVMGLRRELVDLPRTQPEMVPALQRAAATELVRLQAAAQRRDLDDLESFVTSVLARAELPLARVSLARAVVALRQDGEIDEHLAAAALLDLDEFESRLLHSAVLLALQAARADDWPAGPAGHRHRRPAHA